MAERSTPVVVAARRSPVTARGGRLASVTVDRLAGEVLATCRADAVALGIEAEHPADVVLGNCMGPGGNPARAAALHAGLAAPGITIDRQCGSGLSAIQLAAAAIAAGDERMHLAGGVESPSTAPTRTRDGVAYSRAPFTPAGFPDPDMGPAAQRLAEHDGIRRDRQDAVAARSHALALAAGEAGHDAVEIAPVAVVTADDGPRRRMEQLLPRFPPVFGGAPAFAVTAGNTARISDGAAVVALVPSGARNQVPGLAHVASVTVACDPTLPGIGPVDAITRVLAGAGIRLEDVAAIELVEAFGAQVVAVLDRLGLCDERDVDTRVNAYGGTLALGHPWGASGALCVVRLFSRLVRADAPAGSLGLAAAAIGGGMGVVTLFEVVR